MLTYWDAILDKMEDGSSVDSVYTDFAKAFDKCETGVLLQRLKECGVRDKVGIWLAAFLDSAVRQQAVGVDGCLSDLVAVISGVPQGTVLGPCLFLVHLMGISSSVSADTHLSSFADDTRLLRGVRSTEDCELLQADLQKVYMWAEEIGMKFNSKKFEVLRFSSNKDGAPDFSYLAPDGGFIEEKKHLRDLGVRVASDLSFNVQIDSAIVVATQMAGWVLRSFRTRARHLMLVMLRTIIQPRLDYCCVLWSPRDQTSINRIEKVQKDFIGRICDSSLQGKNYWEKIEELGILSQERRRERQQICFVWKVSQGLVDGYSLEWSHSDRRGRTAVPKAIKNSAPSKVKKAREHSFPVHGVRLFNLLPAYLRNEDSADFDLFKNHLDIFLSSIPDQPTVPGLGRQAATNSLLDQLPIHENLF